MTVSPNLPLPPGSFGWPGVGETLFFLRDPDFVPKRLDRHGPIFRTHLLGRPTVVMSGQEANRLILSSHFDHFSWREGWPSTFQELLGRSLFVQDGEEHRRNRRLLMPAFHGPALGHYLATMDRLCGEHLDRWAARGEITWLPALKEMTFEIASALLLGDRGTDTAQLSRWFGQLTQGFFTFPLRFPGTTYQRALIARDRLLAHLDRAIAERQQAPHDRPADVLDLLLQSEDEMGERLSREEIKVQALLMLFAGHETTASMLTSLGMVLGQRPEILQRAIAEQRQLPEHLTLGDLKGMPYLDQIFKELERLYPPASGGFRGVVKSFAFRGYHIPAGWQLLYRMDGSHRDPAIFPNPHHFDPDRHGPDRPKPPEYSLIAFGGGPRVCLGMAFAQMEMKIFAARLLRGYGWSLLPRQDLSIEIIPSVHPRSGLRSQFWAIE